MELNLEQLRGHWQATGECSRFVRSANQTPYTHHLSAQQSPRSMCPCIWLPSSRCVLHDPRFLAREARVNRMDATVVLQDSAG